MSDPEDHMARDPISPELPVLDLGVAPYEPLQELQRTLRGATAEGVIPGVIMLLEHQPVITLGNRRAPSDVRDPELARSRGVDIVTSERGGQATLHAPGQLVTYPIVPVPHRDLGAFVHGLEEVFVLVLGACGIAAERRKGHPGLYVHGEKIMSVGLRCQRWVASHGTSFNVTVDLSLFDLVVSCGEAGLRQTSLQALTGQAWDMQEIKTACLEAFGKVFGWRLSPARRLDHQSVEEALRLATRGMPTAGFEPATPGSGGQCSIP